LLPHHTAERERKEGRVTFKAIRGGVGTLKKRGLGERGGFEHGKGKKAGAHPKAWGQPVYIGFYREKQERRKKERKRNTT